MQPSQSFWKVVNGAKPRKNWSALLVWQKVAAIRKEINFGGNKIQRKIHYVFERGSTRSLKKPLETEAVAREIQ